MNFFAFKLKTNVHTEENCTNKNLRKDAHILYYIQYIYTRIFFKTNNLNISLKFFFFFLI